MHLCQVRAHKITEINVDGMLPKESPETLTVTCSQYYGIAFAMTRTAYSATLEKIEVCVCMSCASLTRTRNSKIDMLKFAGRRPAIINDLTVL